MLAVGNVSEPDNPLSLHNNKYPTTANVDYDALARTHEMHALNVQHDDWGGGGSIGTNL